MRKNKICIIGNNNFGRQISDGQRIKVRTYLNILNKEGFDVDFIELEGWRKRFFHIIKTLKRGIKNNDIILIMAGPSGCRFIIPLVNFFNKKYKKRTVYSVIGTGTLCNLLINRTNKEIADFYKNTSFCLKDERMGKSLKKMDVILLETETLLSTYKSFYHIDNCKVVTNFRINDIETNSSNYKQKISEKLRMAFISRVEKEKGIFDLLSAIKESKILRDNVELDIFGPFATSEEEQEIKKQLNDSVKYLGIIENNLVIQTLQNYDLLCFPTIFTQEGTPGILIESLLAGTPVLSSNFYQAENILSFGFDSISFNMGDVDELRRKLEMIVCNRDILNGLGENALISRKRFIYEYIRNDFLYFITGEKDR